MKTRLRELREAKGWTMDQLAEKSGVSKSQISRIESEKRNWSIESLTKIAEALGKDPLELLVLSDAWFDVPIFGIIIDGGYFAPAEKPETIRVPAALGEVIALRVESDSLYPRYNRGEHVIVQQVALVDSKDAIGRECLVYLTNGQALLRTVIRGSRPRLYNLTSHNQPPLNDVAVFTCRPVVRL